MLKVDMDLNELRQYKPSLTNKEDFDSFWRDTLDESKKIPLNSKLTEYKYPINEVEVYDINYDGFKGSRVNGWYILPKIKSPSGKYPAMIFYHGYTGNKGCIHEYLKWSIQGFAVLAISIRGQGGNTPDNALYSQGGITGWMTNGILDKNEYYYRNVYVDSVRAIDFLWERPEIDKEKIGIYGYSQGGGISIAVAGLDSRPKFTMPVYPYLCHFERALETYQDGPYKEFFDYFRYFDPQMKTRDKVFDTLSYFDGINFAKRIKCPVLLAVCLVDTICPPSTVFAAYNNIDSSKEIRIYPHHGHEALPFHDEELIEFARRNFAG